MSENNTSKPVNRERQRAARALQKTTGMPYTAALREVDQNLTSSTEPSPETNDALIEMTSSGKVWSAPVFTGDQDQDPEDYKRGVLATEPGKTPGCIHSHRVGLGSYRHSHLGWDAPHVHQRDLPSTVGVEIIGRYGSKLYNAAGTKQVDPHCDGPCGRRIRVDDGEEWTLIHDSSQARWANQTGSVGDCCLHLFTTVGIPAAAADAVTPNLLATEVSVDGEVWYPALISSTQRWNGFAIPYFTRDVADQIVALVNSDPDAYETHFAWDGDVLVQTDLRYRDDNNEPEQQRLEPDSNGRYSIGAYSWVWSARSDYPEDITAPAAVTPR